MFLPLWRKPGRVRRAAAVFHAIECLATASADLGASQGVATTDGQTFWVAAGTPTLIEPDNSYLYKYTRSGNVFSLVASRGTSSDWPSGMTQINSVQLYNGVLYVGGNNYNTTPRQGWILEYDPDDLTLLATHAVQNHWCEGGAWRPRLSGGAVSHEFWACYANPVSSGPNVYEVSRYDDAFAHQGNFGLPVTYDSGSLFHEGLAWKGNLLLTMVHEGTTPILAEIFAWDPQAKSFSLQQRLRPPTDECTQGLALAADDRTLWWAERYHGGSPTQDHRIVESRLHAVRVPAGLPRVKANSVQAQSLFAWYPLNDGAGGTAREVVSGTYDATLSGASWLNEPARGACVAFDGTDGKVAIPAALLSAPLGDATICGWFLAEAISSQVMLLSGNKSGANAGDWQLNIEANGAVRFAYNSTGVTLVTLDTAAGRIRRGEWFHLAAALKSGGSGYAKIYVNGIERATSATTGVLGGNGQEIRIGLQSNDDNDFTGKAHDVRFYNAALAADVIAAMAAPTTMFNLWR